MFSRRSAAAPKTAPSHYPRLPFHAIRTFQLLSSLIVAAIMSYFTYHLRNESYPEPWTFIYLFAASLASILALALTIVLHCLLGLNPRLNLGINGALAVLWAVAFAVLTWYMSGTLAEKCDTSTWNEEVGVMVCRLYKAVWTFTLLGFTCTLAALFLDIYVHRAQTSRGIYRLPDLDRKHAPSASRDIERDSYAAGLDAPLRESGVWEDSYRPRGSMGEQEQKDALLARPGMGYGDGVGSGRGTPEIGGGFETGYHGRTHSTG